MLRLSALGRLSRRLTPLLLVAAGLLPLLAVADAAGRHVAPPSAISADTTVLFGPKQFNASSSGALYVEQLTTTVDHAATYVLEVTNGTASGTNRVVNGLVKLNGTTVVTAMDLQNGGHVIAREVWVAEGTNTVWVEAKGNSALYMSVRLLRILPERRPLYRHGFRKTTSQPEVFHDAFSTPRGQPMPGRLYLEQVGVADTVFLNGVRVYAPCTSTLAVCPTFVEPFYDVSLQATNAVRVGMGGAAGSTLVMRVEAVDTMVPVLSLSAPAEALVTREGAVTVSGTVTDDTPPVVLTVDGDTVPVDGGTGAFSHSVALAHDGTHTIQVVARDAATGIPDEIEGGGPSAPAGPTGNVVQLVRTVIRDSEPPALSLTAPADGVEVDAPVVQVSGTVTDATAVAVNVNGVPLTPGAAGAFSAEVPLAEGVNFITVAATDQAGNASSVTRQVTRARPPALTVTAPLDGAVTQAASVAVEGTATGTAPLSLTVNGAPVALGADGSFSHGVALSVGANTLTLVATDGGGRTATATRGVTREAAAQTLPPDPATVAPVLNRTVATTLHASTAFLYTGAAPIQTGVAPGTIQPVRASVLRGRVLTREGEALGGVKVTVRDHPELGQTLSRADGAFDLAVNGGGVLTLDYGRAGYLSAQRQAHPLGQDYAQVGDVALVPLDTVVSQVTLAPAGGQVQVARGSVSQDADGARQPTLFFRPGTAAEMVFPDGTTQPLSTLSIRATEVTVGPNGPTAMPGPLPTGVAYTYALDISVDEARAAGAEHVRFSTPVPFYVDNFLEFPAGTAAPLGWYDYTRAAWVGEKDGVVLTVLSVAGGIAELDTDGDGQADADSTLAFFGIDAAERQRLAAVYPAGKSLWRVELPHFSVWDINWIRRWLNGFTNEDGDPQPPPGGGGGDRPNIDEPRTDDRDKQDDPACEDGSIIECENQVLGETIGIPGTPYVLSYRSDRAPGYGVGRTIMVPLSRATVPDSVRRIEVTIEIAGQVHRQTFPAQPNQEYGFVWDGKDAYGRLVQGRQRATVTVGYVYPRYYRVYTRRCRHGERELPVTWARMVEPLKECENTGQFRRVDGGEETSRVTNIIRVDAPGAPESWDARSLGWGGWTFSANHGYDPVGKVLRLGNGTRRTTQGINNSIQGFAGTGTWCTSTEPCGDGGAATDAYVGAEAIAHAPDGSLYVADRWHNRVRRVAPDGVITTIAGTGAWGFSGDGGPALQARLDEPMSIALGPDGSVYVGDWNFRIRRIAPDGIITTIAGTGVRGFGGDDGPATAAKLGLPTALAVAPDGGIYVADYLNHRVRRIGPDGVISTVAGTGTPGYGREGEYGAQAALSYPFSIALHPNGDLYISDTGNHRIRRLDGDGILVTVAGNGLTCDSYQLGCVGDGLAATGARVTYPDGIAVGRDGTLYIAESWNDRVRQVAADGIITTVAGGGPCSDNVDPTCGDGGTATAARVGSPRSVAVGRDGALYVAEGFRKRIRRVATPLPGYTDQDIAIVSQDGEEIYYFTPEGRHLRTRDALTGVIRYAFDYDSAGRLAAVTDVDGRVTTVTRDGSTGMATEVLSPDGHLTTLSADGDGYLASVANAAGEDVELGYAPGGLLASLRDPKGNEHAYTYNSLGRLVRDDGPAGGAKTLARTALGNGSEVALSTVMGRTTRYAVTELPEGGSRRTTTSPSGLSTVTTSLPDGTATAQSPDGTVARSTVRPDPVFGMQAPLQAEQRITTPGGLLFRSTLVRRAVLADLGDPLSLLSRTDSITVNGRVSTTVYDALQRSITSRSAAGRESVTRIDSAGRMVERSVAGITPALYSYDARGFATGVTQGTRSWSYGYNARGELAQATDPLGRTDRYEYDLAGRMTVRRLHNGTEIHYTYDANGNLTSLAPAGRPAHLFEYTAADQGEAYSPPSLGSGGWVTRSRYNLDGQLEQVIRPDSQTISFGYDGGGRLSTVTTPDGQTVYGYHALTGVLSTITAGSNALGLTYDGRLPLSMTWTGEVSGQVGVSYDNSFRVTGQTINGSHAVDFRYDADGLLTGIGALGFTRSGQNGLLLGSTLGQVTTAHGYTGFGELSADTVRYGGTVIFARGYTTDSIGRIRGLTETAGGTTTAYAFAYDSVGRLVEVRKDGAPVESYEYDTNGNRIRAVTQAGVLTGVVDAQDRLLSYGGAAYTYGAGGELETKVTGTDTTRYRYDVQGNLKEVRLPGGNVVTYVTDPSDRRVGKRVNGVLVQAFLYQDQLEPVAELDGAGNVVSRFVYGSRSNVPDYMVKDGVTYRIVSDHLGSVRLVVNTETGAVAQRLAYDGWGNVTEDSNPGFQPFGYAGGLADSHTGLTRFGARDYDSRVGRWTSRDPSGFAGGDANLFAYAYNDPVNLIDPDGRLPILVVAGMVWAGVELALTLADLLDFLNTLADECATNGDKLQSGGLFVAGAVGPLGGYNTAGKTAGKYIPNTPLRQQNVGGVDIPLPDPRAQGPHTTLGGRNPTTPGQDRYLQSAEFRGNSWPPANGHEVPVSRTDWTDHGRGDHTNPHQHPFTWNGKQWVQAPRTRTGP
ncbi:MAG TPA: RHS repeat-associated core domain-containing protein [Longimicrobium sp.]